MGKNVIAMVIVLISAFSWAWAEPTRTCSEEQVQKSAKLDEIRRAIRIDPAAAMRALDVPVEEFEAIAKVLYLKSRIAQSNRAKDATVNVDDFRRGQRWWCFQSSADGLCADTKDECEQARARSRNASACSHQERASCFRLHRVLQDDESTFCAPTIKACKDQRSWTAKHMAVDVRIKSDCAGVSAEQTP